MKVGNLVKYRFDHLSKKLYIVTKVWVAEHTKETRCTLAGWKGTDGLPQVFPQSALEVISEAG